MQLRRPLPGPVVAEIVDVHTINDVRDAALGAQRLELREQLVLAMEATVNVVLDIIRIVEFKGSSARAGSGFTCELMASRLCDSGAKQNRR